MNSKFAWTAAVVWTAAILVALVIPAPAVPQDSTVGFDKLIHFALFLIFSILWMYAGTGKYLPVWVLLGGLAYGIGTEYAQDFLPIARTPDPMDAAVNAAGTIVGISVYFLWDWQRIHDTKKVSNS